MNSEPTILTIKKLTTPEKIDLEGRTDMKQTLVLREDGFGNKKDGGKGRNSNTFLIEIWNSGIDKYDLNSKFKDGDKVEVVLWMNGTETQTNRGTKHKNTLAIKSIKKAS